jgi:hypothetical protein
MASSHRRSREKCYSRQVIKGHGYVLELQHGVVSLAGFGLATQLAAQLLKIQAHLTTITAQTSANP